MSALKSSQHSGYRQNRLRKGVRRAVDRAQWTVHSGQFSVVSFWLPVKDAYEMIVRQSGEIICKRGKRNFGAGIRGQFSVWKCLPAHPRLWVKSGLENLGCATGPDEPYGDDSTMGNKYHVPRIPPIAIGPVVCLIFTCRRERDREVRSRNTAIRRDQLPISIPRRGLMAA